MTDHRTQIDLTGVGIPEVPLLGRYRERHSHVALDPHTHYGLWEICFLIRGRQVYRVANQDYALGPMDLFITRPDEVHDSHEQPQEPGALYWMHLAPPSGNRRFLGQSAADGRMLMARLSALERRQFHGSRLLRDLFQRAWDRVDGDCQLRRMQLTAIILEILFEVVRCGVSDQGEISDPDINRVLAYVERNLRLPLAVADLAEVAGLSESWFKAKFRRVVGLPPADYLMRRRIDRAREELARSGKSVTAIAFDLGFASSQYFATTFRRYVNCSPTQYRAQLAGNLDTGGLGSVGAGGLGAGLAACISGT
ncbi:MAG: AraC family transcriptional regulator [Lentisphaerae bacterium]|jgi:AraC-like DNA-binding protein|nr:AraC family transcriptional regulator [Lentisphaerota bacterium]MBT4815040.1 AraC family transcriptional regulator [Lentisphaerota bacterium]MBT5611861.1 AraC family transcriptional regulator [Lentisphaerota bacterium]MBT7845930.1 AraC family transcriptional regulator [Lentisphaerota bacterium]